MFWTTRNNCFFLQMDIMILCYISSCLNPFLPRWWLQKWHPKGVPRVSSPVLRHLQEWSPPCEYLASPFRLSTEPEIPPVTWWWHNLHETSSKLPGISMFWRWHTPCFGDIMWYPPWLWLKPLFPWARSMFPRPKLNTEPDFSSSEDTFNVGCGMSWVPC